MGDIPRSSSRSNNQLVERFSLIGLHLQLAVRNFFGFYKLAYRYYRNLRFFLIDSLLVLQYFFTSPYSECRKFRERKGLGLSYLYGPTPLVTLDEIARRARILSSDRVMDMGTGMGRTAFWLSQFVRSETIGVDINPQFMRKAKRVKRLAKAKRVSFRQEDFRTTSLEGINVIYLYGTALDDPIIETLTKRFAKMPEGTRIITTTYPVTAMAEDPNCFRLLDTFPGRYPWGYTPVYIHEVVDPSLLR